uniref:Trypsin-1 n=1 Tax=Zeugodacus cucurbitae TaxID=28588 RepID=A0A0A1WVC7_ZEUCU
MWTHCVVVLVALVGVVSSFPEGRIVNGIPTVIGRYPFMVSVRLAKGAHTCGASIIAPRWILTAAHCIYGRAVNEISIQFAATVINRRIGNFTQVERLIVHEDYRPGGSYVNDIALIKLHNGLVYDYVHVAPVALPDPYFEVPQTESVTPGVLLGWGLNATGGRNTPTLEEVQLKIYSDRECGTRHGGRTSSDQICAGVDEGGKGQCTGDSGGPLLYKGSIQLGIVSWSIKPCGIRYYPGVYTKVSHYIGWIRNHTDAVM